MHGRIWYMMVKEFIQVFRDPKTRVVIIVPPIIQLLIFGYAATTDVQHVATIVLDLDNSADSRELVNRFAHNRYFDVRRYVSDEATARGLIDRGEAQALLRIEHGYSADLAAGRTARAQIILDGSDSNTAGIAASYAARIVETLSRELLLERVARSRGAIRAPPELDLEVRAWFNENLESRNYFVPGVIALIVMLATLLLTSMAVVREKEIGTMEQILVTPITPAEFILGKTVPFALIGLGDVVLITAVGVLWFGVPLRGSLAVLGASACLYLLPALGVGLLISTISQTQQQAMMSTFFFFFPAILLSGFMFPIANMPRVIQYLTYINPLRYFLVIIRGVFLKGVGVEVLWPQMAALAALGVVTLTLAVTRFHKTLK
jgi:ABC-2 type transport system permease protein